MIDEAFAWQEYAEQAVHNFGYHYGWQPGEVKKLGLQERQRLMDKLKHQKDYEEEQSKAK